MKIFRCGIVLISFLSAMISAQSETASVSARAGVEAGNQAWIEAVKTGDITRITATYTEDGIDCGANGECLRGRLAIEQHLKKQLTNLGRARSAAVKTWGSTQQGEYVYEWGRAEAIFDGGKKLEDRYLTVWQRQADGGWKIFRNLLIPGK